MAGQSIASGVGQQVIGKGYPVFSWYAIMAGMGIFPGPEGPALAHCAGGALQHGRDRQPARRAAPPTTRTTASALGHIAPRRTDPSLQIYFW